MTGRVLQVVHLSDGRGEPLQSNDAFRRSWPCAQGKWSIVSWKAPVCFGPGSCPPDKAAAGTAGRQGCVSAVKQHDARAVTSQACSVAAQLRVWSERGRRAGGRDLPAAGPAPAALPPAQPPAAPPGRPALRAALRRRGARRRAAGRAPRARARPPQRRPVRAVAPLRPGPEAVGHTRACAYSRMCFANRPPRKRPRRIAMLKWLYSATMHDALR